MLSATEEVFFEKDHIYYFSLHCNQIPGRKQLKDRSIRIHSLSGHSPSWQRQHGAGTPHLTSEKESDINRAGTGDRKPSKYPLMTHFLQLGHTSHMSCSLLEQPHQRGPSAEIHRALRDHLHLSHNRVSRTFKKKKIQRLKWASSYPRTKHSGLCTLILESPLDPVTLLSRLGLQC